MEEKDLKIDFSFTDEFGQETRLVKNMTTAALLDRGTFEFLVDEFKLFLIANGWEQDYVERRIKLMEE